jgi:MFS family permease
VCRQDDITKKIMHQYKKRNGPLLNKSLRSLIIISGLFMFAFSMFSPIFAIFVEKIGGGISTAANSYAIFLAVAGGLTFFASKYENKMKEKELAVAWAQIVLGIGYVLYCFTKNVAMLFLVQVILGIGEALYWPAFHAIYAKHTDKENSVAQWGIYDGLAYIFPAIGAAIGGLMAEKLGFNFVFASMAILSFICGIYIIILPRKVL